MCRRVARNLRWRGLFRRYETKLKQFTLGIGTILCPKLVEDQKKKKVSAPVGIEFCDRVLFQFRVKAVTFLLPIMPLGGIFAFRAKIGLKSTKKMVFCTICMPIAPLPPGYATGNAPIVV